tara:strand:+ start:131 stop:1090 length:960 start_codon:yes stop_codon:yes gene_type:complete
MPIKIAILDDYQDVVKTLDCLGLLKNFEVQVHSTPPASLDALVDRLQDCDAIVLIRERTQIDADLLARLPNLKVISQTGKISNHLDAKACQQYGVNVLEGSGSPVAPAELCWTLIMAAQRHLLAYATHLQQGHWQNSGELGLGRCLNGKTLGIWGYGKIGKRIARYAQAFEMNVLVWGSETSRQQAVLDGYLAAVDKTSFFVECDIISLNLRLNDQTQGCVTAADLQLMKTDALLVNISRAELIQPGALYQGLLQGRPGYAAIDVFESEPVNLLTELLVSLPNVLATPHIGFVEKSGYELYFEAAFQNLVSHFGFQHNR